MLRPYITFTNRLGEVIFLKQANTDEPKMLNPFDYRTMFPCPQTDESEGLQVSENLIYNFLIFYTFGDKI